MNPTAAQLAQQADREYSEAISRRDRAAGQINTVIRTANAQGRSHLTLHESALVERATADRTAAREDARRAAARRSDARGLADDDERYIALSGQSSPAPLSRAGGRPAYDRVARVGYEARTYRPDEDPNGRNFLLDVTRNFLHADPGATERLARHMAEERVERPLYAERAAGDTTTGNWTGLTVPQYLTDLYAPQISALRPFVDVCCAHTPLPPQGMSLNFSKITTGSSVALQTSELTGVSATSLDDTLGTAAVQTAAGMQNVSRQAIERGTGIENATMQDLMRKYAVAVDQTVIQQASTGLTNVAQTVTYTSASPTGPEFWPFMYQASSKLEAALLGVAYPSHIVMHSRRWNWLASQVSSSWPIVNSAGVPAQSSAFSLTTEYGPQVRAVLASGMKVVVDNNVLINGSSQDEVYVTAETESMWFAEDPHAPLMIRAEQPNAPSLGVLLVCYGYFAYFSRYANPASKIVGTGTAAPAGF